jgi:hypothetical protein
LAERLARDAPARAVLVVQRYLESTQSAADTLARLQSLRPADREPHILPFLKGLVALHARDGVAAQSAFSEAIAVRPSWRGGWVGAVLSHCYGQKELPGAVRPLFARMIEAADFDLPPGDSEFRRRIASLA